MRLERTMTHPFHGLGAVLLALGSSAIAQDAQDEPQRSWTLTADRIYTVSGGVIEGGSIVIADGKIVSVLPLGAGVEGDDTRDDLHFAAITPGLIDLACQVSLGAEAVEQRDEATADIPITGALNLFAPRWKRELDGGVTTVLATGPGRNVIGGLASVIHTGGGFALEDRLIERDVAVWGAMGSEPSQGNRPAFGTPDLFNRRPTTRMGVEWVARKTFYDARRAMADASQAFPGSEQLAKVLSGELPLVLRASATQDIRTAIYLKEEFAIPELILTSAAEAWRELDMLERSGASVVLPPFAFDGRSEYDDGFFAWDTVKDLDERGIVFALSGHSSNDSDKRMALQPAYAVRAGLSPEKALAAATLVPARMLGIDDRVGSIESGKLADLVLWNGDPTSFGSAVVGVLLNGEMVRDPRPVQ